MKILKHRNQKRRILLNLDAALVDRIDAVKSRVDALELEFDLAAAAAPGIKKLVESAERDLAEAGRARA